MTVDAKDMDAIHEGRVVEVESTKSANFSGFNVTAGTEVTGPGTYKFAHGLRQTPIVIQIQFSLDSSFDDVHIVQWPWEADQSRGPVSIRADLKNVYLEFSGAHVFGNWSYGRGWTHHPRGYFRVIAG